MVETVEEETEGKGPNGVEILKAASEYLRGSLAEEFADPQIFISDAAYQLLKFHGSYQQDDRDLRNERRRAGDTYAFSFMVRLRLPGGDVHPELFLALDRLSDEIGNGSLRLTTRQSVQLHGIGKHDLRTVIRTINAELSSTLGACGDVNRNVMASSAPLATPAYQLVQDVARRISTHLLPRSGAYAELWLDADEAGGGQELARIGAEGRAVEGNGTAIDEGRAEGGTEVEPLYGRTYLPRKFKTAVAVAGDNSVDLFTNDLGLVPIFEGERHAGWNVYVGGGLGRTHRKPETFPRLADTLGFIGVDDLLPITEAVVIVQRDNGDRTNRRHARLKYLIHDRGIDWFREQVAGVSGVAIEAARPVEWTRGDDLLGWHEQGDGRWFLGLRVMNGRLVDRDGGPQWRSALRRIASELRLSMRITPNQNLYLWDVTPAQRFRVDEILAENAIESGADLRGLRRLSMACPALPTCGLAVTEAERALPDVLDTLQVTFDTVGVSDAVPTVRMTGCPNGCARPYVAEIGLVGDAVDRYQVWLGGDAAGTRLARHVADRVHKDQLPAMLEPLLVRYRDERLDGEAFGDFLDRVRPDIVVPEAAPRPVRHVPAAEPAAVATGGGRVTALPLNVLPFAGFHRVPLPVDAERLDAKGVLRLALDVIGPERIALSTALGPEGIVILDLLLELIPNPRVFTLDTGRLPEETHALIDRVREHFGISVEVIFPDAAEVERMARERGANLFYRSVDDRRRCCEVRKVLPLRRALRGLDGWITGVRRDQIGTRAETPKIGVDLEHGMIWKVAPLADWTEDEVWARIRQRGLPYNALHDQGYPSVGCAPCSRAVEPGQNARSGRWWWEEPDARECGIHLPSERTAAVIQAGAA